MKLYHVAIIFALIALALMNITDNKENEIYALREEKRKIDVALESAVDDACQNIISIQDGIIELEKDKAITSFFNSLYSSLGLNMDKVAQEKIRNYVPVILLTSEDGYYVYYSDQYKDKTGAIYTSKSWTEKLPYSYEDDDFIYSFTLSDDVIIYDKKNILGMDDKVISVDYHQFQEEEEYEAFRKARPQNIMLDDELYYLTKRDSIIKRLEESLSYYTSRHNEIAQHNGIAYEFILPTIDKSELIRSIESQSIIVIFQGYPYSGVDQVYNRVACAGSSIIKNVFFIEEKENYSIYHYKDCPIYTPHKEDKRLYSLKSCSENGSWACSECNKFRGLEVPDILK